LILRRIVKIVATKCRILRLKCTKIDFGWVSAPDPAGGAYSALPKPLAAFNGSTSKGRGWEGRRGWLERKEEGPKGERKEIEGREGARETPCVSLNFP